MKKSNSTITEEADYYRAQLKTLREFIAQCTTPNGNETIRMKDFANRLVFWADQHKRPTITGMHKVRRHLQAWGYTVQPDHKTWHPMLQCHSLINDY